MTAPDHEQAERLLSDPKWRPRRSHYAELSNKNRDLAAQLAEAKEEIARQIELRIEEEPIAMRRLAEELYRAQAQLAEAQEALAQEARIHIRESARANTEKGRADRAEAQLAEREREVELLAEAVVNGELEGARELAEQTIARIDAIAATHSDSEERG